MRIVFLMTGAAALALAAGLAGCSQSGQTYHEVTKGVKVKEEPHSHEHGPHGGHLVELGEEEYHAEVVFDAKDNKLSVYLLDSSAKKPVPIEGKDLTLRLTIDGQPKSFTATAAPQSDDPKGKSSRFELAGNPDVKAHVKDEEDLKGSVSTKIGGKDYTGEITHEHGH